MKARIKDYQIIKDAELEFLPGITAIVGNSNNGKSSIIRAIEAAINNKGGSGFINHDSDFCEVEIEDNGHKIKWLKHKKPGKSLYEIDGKVLKKIGQKQLDEVGELLNMSEIEVNIERFRLNFWKQMDFPFLVGKPPYQLFDFISRSNEQELIGELQSDSAESLKQLTKDADYKIAQIDTKKGDIVKLNDDIKALKNFADFNIEKFDLLSEIYDTLNNSINNLSSVNTAITNKNTELTEITSKLSKLSAITDTIDKSFTMYKQLRPMLTSLEDINKKVVEYKENIKTLTQLEKSVSTKLLAIENIINKIATLSDIYDRYLSLLQELDKIQKSKELFKESLVTIQKNITAVTQELSKFTVCPLCGSSLGGQNSGS